MSYLTDPIKAVSKITKQLLAIEDANWVSSDGFVLIWETEMLHGDKTVAHSYVWGHGPRLYEDPTAKARAGGWSTMRYALVYPSFKEAMAATKSLRSSVTIACPGDVNIRIVKVSIRPPVTILSDVSANLLQRMAEL